DAPLPENGRIVQDGADSQPSETRMKTETIDYKDGDVTLRGYLAFDDTKSGKRPGVLVMPEARRTAGGVGLRRLRRRPLRQRRRGLKPAGGDEACDAVVYRPRETPRARAC